MNPNETQSFGAPVPEDASGPRESTSAEAVTARPPVALGEVVAGKYRVDKVLAAGGMGVVVAASHLQLDEQVAIKFLREDVLGDREVVERFAREARTAIKIKSEHIARVVDVGALPNGTPYMVMEYLHGEDLATFIRTRGPLPLAQAVELVLQACEAISEAHGLGIVHRDLKPANLFVTRRADGILAAKVLDFGISKKQAGSATDTQGLTGKRVALGSPCYMSPEQLACTADVDRRTDIWSIGVTLFEMLTGTLPFAAETTLELCGKVLRDQPCSLRALVPSVPAALESVVGKCLQKDRTKRFADVAELALALAPFGPDRARSSAQRVWRTVQAAGPADAGAETVALDGGPIERDPTRVVWDQASARIAPRRRYLTAITFLSALGVAAAIGVFAWRSSTMRDTSSGTRNLMPTAPLETTPSPAASLVSDVPPPPMAEQLEPPVPPKTLRTGPKRGPHGATQNAAATSSGRVAPPARSKQPANVYDARD
jgi:serine/threonine-protein kinase